MITIERIKNNTYYIDTATVSIGVYALNDKDVVLLDSGFHRDEEEISALLDKRNWRVKGIINSHAHYDHCGNNLYFKKKDSALFAMPEAEAFLTKNTQNRKLGMPRMTVAEIEKKYNYLMFDCDYLIAAQGGTFEFCGAEFEAFPTPGHSLQHMCIKTADDVWYLGDSLLAVNTIRHFKVPYSYILSMDIRSKRKLYQLQGSHFLMAHKGVILQDELKEHVDENIFYLHNRSQEILASLSDGLTFEQIDLAIADRFNIHRTHAQSYGHISRMMKFYIEYLLERGQLEARVVDDRLLYFKTQEDHEPVALNFE